MIDRHINLDVDRVGFGDALVRAMHLLRATTGIPGADPYEALREWTIFPYASRRQGWRKWAFKLTHGLLWRQESFNRSLLAAENIQAAFREGEKPDLVIVAPFHVQAMRSGGAVRVGGMAHALAAYGRVLIVSIEDDYLVARRELWPGVSLVSAPRSRAFLDTVDKVKPVYGYYGHFLTVAQRPDLLPEFQYILKEAVSSARAVMVVGPFAWPAIQDLVQNKCVIYDSHDDVMQFLDVVDFNADRTRTLGAISDLENTLCRHANIVSMTTDEDVEKLRVRLPEVYAKTVVVRNGVDLEASRPTTPSLSRRLARAVGMDATLHLFLGTGHGPNLEAVRWMSDTLAVVRPHDWFVVLGMPFHLYKNSAHYAPPPRNLIFTGSVSHDVKESVMALATTALCPMRLGTGSSLKVPDCLAHGKITLATSVGARGFPGVEEVVTMLDREHFAAEIDGLIAGLADNLDAWDARSRGGRVYVERELSWEHVVKPYEEILLDAFRRR